MSFLLLARPLVATPAATRLESAITDFRFNISDQQGWRDFILCCFLWVSFWMTGAPSLAFGAPPPIGYTLDLRDPSSHRVRVTMTVTNAAPSTEIQFPAWNNLYQMRDFVHNVEHLQAHCNDRRRDLLPVDVNTWQLGAEPCSRIVVRYAVVADEDSVFSCVLNGQHSFLNPAQLLFYVPGERNRETRVKFLLPEGWKLRTLLQDGDEPDEFKAPSYDSLADSPAEAGPDFQEYSYTQSGATYRVLVQADPASYSSKKLLESIQKITAAETALMRDVPFSRYTFIFHFLSADGGGGMEHRDGTAIGYRASDLRSNWEGLEATIAHEFFHLWNVKRIRPQRLEPIDYVRGNDTRDLWFCEGVTSAYQELVLLRAGLISRQTFYQRLADEIGRLQERPARLFQSAELSGMDAWLERYPAYLRPARSISYYNKGAILGFLLDLGVRHGSHNLHSLDDVMRRLNEDFARRRRFFTDADLREIIAGLAPDYKGLDAFFREYVSGTPDLDYDTYLGYAGLRLRQQTVERAALGFLAARSHERPIHVEFVEPGSSAAHAGLERGDVLVRLNGQNLTSLPQDLSSLKPRQRVRLEVQRNSRTLNLKFDLGAKRDTTYKISEFSDASEDQLRVRNGWLEGKP